MAETLTQKFDLVIVGAGIVGLAHALAARRKGLLVAVVDREARAIGASVRNFGFVTVTGQQAGECWRRAMRSRDVWLEVAPKAGIPVEHEGLLVAARRPEAMAVLDAFPELFGPEARAEVPVIGTVAGHAVAGQIDRLVIRPDEILIVDFKSNRAPPGAAEDVSTAYAAQLALYRALLAPLYPGRVLRCRLIWTATASATDLPAALLDAALAALGPGSRLA